MQYRRPLERVVKRVKPEPAGRSIKLIVVKSDWSLADLTRRGGKTELRD